MITFLTWSSVGGTLCRNTVVLARGGVVSAKRDILAAHIGPHTEVGALPTPAQNTALVTAR